MTDFIETAMQRAQEITRQIEMVKTDPGGAHKAMIRGLFFIQQALTSVKLNNDQLDGAGFDSLRMAEQQLEDFFEPPKEEKKGGVIVGVELSKEELELAIRSLQDIRLPIKQKMDRLHANFNFLTTAERIGFDELEQRLQHSKDLEGRLRQKLKEMV